MRTLILDIETRPNIAHIWQAWNINYVSPNQMIEVKDIISFAAKWHGQKKRTQFYSTFDHGKEFMLMNAWQMMNRADVIVHYSGRTFDVPLLQRGFLQLGMIPPSPYKQIDLLDVVKKQFAFPYNTLDYVCTELGIGSKVKHAGHELWVKCMAGDPEAWDTMERYNKGDVILTEKLYDRIRPWITNHPSVGAYKGKDVCSKCGSADLVKEGYSYTANGRYQRYHCQKCHGWLTSIRRDAFTRIKSAT